jgi:hypothetical protein
MAELATRATEDTLISAVSADATALRAQPPRVRGPVVARALDPETGLISGGKINAPVPADLDPLLQDRIRAMGPSRHFSDPGSHAEVYAVDELLKARRAAGLSVSDETLQTFVTYQEWLNKPYGPAKMCPNCSGILHDVKSIAGKRP